MTEKKTKTNKKKQRTDIKKGEEEERLKVELGH